jgi:HEAT repeat protein
MPQLLLTLLFGAALLQGPTPPAPPDPEKIKAAVARLEEAFTKGKSPERIQALEAAVPLLDAKVIEWVRKGLRDSDPAVVQRALESLRFMRHPDALEALHDYYRRERAKLRKDDELLGRVLKAVAQHQSAKSIDVLADDPWGNTSNAVIEARILGLGNIRAVESVEALLGLMRVAGPLKVQPHMNDFRLALVVLTGSDQGNSQDAWMKWWNDHKQGFQVAAKQAPMAKPMQLRWDYYWGNEMKRDRPPGRGDRGNDPEGEPKGGEPKGKKPDGTPPEKKPE